MRIDADGPRIAPNDFMMARRPAIWQFFQRVATLPV
jgi:hypothetical protein